MRIGWTSLLCCATLACALVGHHCCVAQPNVLLNANDVASHSMVHFRHPLGVVTNPGRGKMNMILSRHQALALCSATLFIALLCCVTQHHLTHSSLFSVIMKPGLQLIDMEEDNPGGLLNHGHPEDELESWECPPILIENDVGKDPVNISDVFKCSAEGQWMEKKCDKIKNNIGIRLPAAVCPPDWNSVDHVREKIIQHARLSSVELVKFKAEKKI